LITPGDDEHKLRKAAASEADCCILEWEDGVYDARKQVAREITGRALSALDWGDKERLVRINALDTPHAADDIIAAVAHGADAIMLPKVYGADDVLQAAELLTDAERACGRAEGSVRLWTMIETALGLINVEAIAQAHPRMTAMLFGGGDLGADLRFRRVQLGANRFLGPVRYEYIYAYGKFVVAARAAGIDPVNMGYTTYTDLDGTRQDAEYSFQFGFSGTLALSVRQLPVINAAFSPSPDDLAWADEVLGSFADANVDERTVIVVEDEMTDGPYVRSANHVRRLQRAILERDG